MMAEAVANQTTQQVQSPVEPTKALSEAIVATPPVKDERVSNKLQVLVQREKQALEKEQRAKQREAEIELKYKALTDRESKIEQFESLKSTDPMKALELLGLSYQDLTNTALNDGAVTPEIQVRKVEEKLDSYLKSQEAAERERAEAAQKQAKQNEERVITDFKKDISTFIDADPKQYELIKFEGMEEFIYLTIDEHYNRTVDPQTGIGKIMSIKEAADKVEAMLEKKYNDARKLTKFNIPNPTPKVAIEADKGQRITFQERPRVARTLTNQLSATPQQPRTRPLTDDQRIQKAIAYARGLRP